MNTNYDYPTKGTSHLLRQKFDATKLQLWTFEGATTKLSFVLEQNADCVLELIQGHSFVLDELLNAGVKQHYYQIKEVVKEGLIYRIEDDLYLKKEEFDIDLYVYTLSKGKTNRWKSQKHLMKVIASK